MGICHPSGRLCSIPLQPLLVALSSHLWYQTTACFTAGQTTCPLYPNPVFQICNGGGRASSNKHKNIQGFLPPFSSSSNPPLYHSFELLLSRSNSQASSSLLSSNRSPLPSTWNLPLTSIQQGPWPAASLFRLNLPRPGSVPGHPTRTGHRVGQPFTADRPGQQAR